MFERHNTCGTRGMISGMRGDDPDSHSYDIWGYLSDAEKDLSISDTWYGAPICINSYRQFE